MSTNGTSALAMNNGAQRQDLIVRFDTNVPQEVALAPTQPDNPIVQSTHGYQDQILYYLTGGRRTYVTPYCSEQIAKLAPDPGEPFIICKREVKNNQRRSIEWQVYRIPQPAPDPPAQRLPPSSAPRVAQSAPAPQPSWDDDPGPLEPPPLKSGIAPINRPVNAPPNVAQFKPPMKIPYDVAFNSMLRVVVDGLKAAGEQWSDQSKQDLLSTLIIAAGRDGSISWVPSGGSR